MRFLHTFLHTMLRTANLNQFIKYHTKALDIKLLRQKKYPNGYQIEWVGEKHERG